jgi:hypothetical protein
MFCLENFTGDLGLFTRRRSLTTAGNLMAKLTEWISRLYSSRTSTLPSMNKVIAFFQLITFNGS